MKQFIKDFIKRTPVLFNWAMYVFFTLLLLTTTVLTVEKKVWQIQ